MTAAARGAWGYPTEFEPSRRGSSPALHQSPSCWRVPLRGDDDDKAMVGEACLRQSRLCCPFDIFHEYVEAFMGRSVWTHEFGDPDRLRSENHWERSKSSLSSCDTHRQDSRSSAVNIRIAKKMMCWPFHPDAVKRKGAPSRGGRTTSPYTCQQWLRAWHIYVRAIKRTDGTKWTTRRGRSVWRNR